MLDIWIVSLLCWFLKIFFIFRKIWIKFFFQDEFCSHRVLETVLSSFYDASFLKQFSKFGISVLVCHLFTMKPFRLHKSNLYSQEYQNNINFNVMGTTVCLSCLLLKKCLLNIKVTYCKFYNSYKQIFSFEETD